MYTWIGVLFFFFFFYNVKYRAIFFQHGTPLLYMVKTRVRTCFSFSQVTAHTSMFNVYFYFFRETNRIVSLIKHASRLLCFKHILYVLKDTVQIYNISCVCARARERRPTRNPSCVLTVFCSSWNLQGKVDCINRIMMMMMSVRSP